MVKKKRQQDMDDGSSTDSSDENMLQSPLSSCNCQHVKKALDTAKLRKLLKSTGLAFECSQCQQTHVPSPAAEVDEMMVDDNSSGFEYDNTLWLCLKCGTQLCGRSKNQHALKHFKTPRSDSHALAMNTRSFEIWCYECDNEVSANSRKNLLECVELVKKMAQQPPLLPTDSPILTPGGVEIENIEQKIASTWESMRPLISMDADNEQQMEPLGRPVPLPPPLPPPIPGMAKRINDSSGGSLAFGSFSHLPLINTGSEFTTSNRLRSNMSTYDHLPRVRGLTNLGNTCFFNAVIQCLAQTPYLLEVLKESAEPGEEFILPGGVFKYKDEEMELPPIKGTLSSWGSLTCSLATTLEDLQSGGGVYNPSRLFEKLCNKCPQFRGGDQHDSHELLRHLLESVRSEDLKRYQRVILQSLGYKDQDINTVSEELRQKCKIYGNQAADRILRPEQVFRGFLVSTLTCQECYNVSSRHEYFLDMSLPVSVEKPQPPQRRKNSPDNESPVTSFYLNLSPKNASAPPAPTKAELKKQKKKARKVERESRRQNKLATQHIMLEDVTGAAGDAVVDGPAVVHDSRVASTFSSSGSSSEHSDADVEDNLMDDKDVKPLSVGMAPLYDPNGNNELISPLNPEKRGDSPENMDKDSLDEDENDSGIATSPANTGSFLPSSDTNGGASGNDSALVTSTTTKNKVLAVGLSEKGASLVRQISLGDSGTAASTSPQPMLTNGEVKDEATLAAQLDQMQMDEQRAARMRTKRVRTQSYSDWSTTIAPRYQCEDGECSVQSCLNNFTAVELMTGNNKVGCDNCTKRINGDDPKAKTVYTNATKQFLISSPPAVLILHLKRFQLGQRCMFRKLTRAVSFPMVLDIAPFCGSKVKNLPNIDRKQKKLLYALYGVVEHSGGMYGGHYTAFVKVRAKLPADDKRWKFIPQGSKAELDQDDEQRKKLEELLVKEKARELRMKAAEDSDDFSNSCTSSTSSSCDPEEGANDVNMGGTGGAVDEASNVQVPGGKWYYVSDSRVQEISEEEVLRAQAYLLFYERIY